MIEAGISAPVGQAWTHSPQATQVEAPIGSPKSKTISSLNERPAMPMTSLTWTSRQARTQRLQWMQASRLTRMATWLASRRGISCLGRAGKRLVVVPCASAMSHRWLERSRASSRAGWSARRSSMTMRRALSARSVAVWTVMPSVGVRMQEAASTRSPSISTMQARQLPSGR
jgi:hypothetical protein